MKNLRLCKVRKAFVRLIALHLCLHMLIAPFNLATSARAVTSPSALQETIVCVLSCSYFIVVRILKLLAWLMSNSFCNELYRYLEISAEEKPVTSPKASKLHCALGTSPFFHFTFCIFVFLGKLFCKA